MSSRRATKREEGGRQKTRGESNKERRAMSASGGGRHAVTKREGRRGWGRG